MAVLLSFVAVAAVAVTTAVVATQTRRDYAAAPLCAGSPGPDCRTLEEATVTSLGSDTQPVRIVVGLRSSDGRSLTAQLSPNYRTRRLPARGAQVEIEVWRGQITRLQLPGLGLVRTYGPWT